MTDIQEVLEQLYNVTHTRVSNSAMDRTPGSAGGVLCFGTGYLSSLRPSFSIYQMEKITHLLHNVIFQNQMG